MITVISLFDGIAGARVALDRLGIECRYFASEIDKYAIKVATKNYPDITHIGDVCSVDYRDGVLYWQGGSEYVGQVDLLIGGSPCQGFSFAGEQLQFDDPRSRLFFEYERLLKQINPRYFLLENVIMKKQSEAVISKCLGVGPIQINSDAVSAQNRKRLYWTNASIVSPPKGGGPTWGNIREYGADPRFYYSQKGLAWIERHGNKTGKKLRVWRDEDKCQMIEASHYKKYSSQRFFGIMDNGKLRYITPIECERAQTFPDNYTAGISNTQRYKCLGNSFTVAVVEHILRAMDLFNN